MVQDRQLNECSHSAANGIKHLLAMAKLETTEE